MGDDSGDPSMSTRLLGRYGGPIVAGLGFVITRFFVAEAVTLSGEPIAVAATAGSLVVGLSLTVAGVGLAVGAFTSAFVADVSRGCLLGTGATAAAIAITIAATGVGVIDAAVGTQLLVANVLLAGAIGGMVNGYRKAFLRQRRAAVMRGANRARFINRLLRHEVLNAATIIDGHADLLRDDGGDRERSVGAIRRGAARIESTINGVGTIAEDRTRNAVSLAKMIRTAVDSVGDGGRYDRDVSIDVGSATADSVRVDADDRLSIVFERLIEHAVDVRGAETVRIETTVERHAATVTMIDDGSLPSDRQRGVLERGSFPEFDDPTNGFELQAASLLVGEYEGTIRVERGEETRVVVRLPLKSADAAVAAVGVEYPSLVRAITAGFAAGIAMGGLFLTASGTLPVIGALYGAESAAIGWITHQFHSVVFALLFVAGVSRSPLSDRTHRPLAASVAGLAWGVLLWLVAAGLVMPIWLRAVGIPATLPNLPWIGLLSHGLWGVTLGVGYVLIGGRFE